MNVSCPKNSSVKLHFITDVFNGYFSKNVGFGRREFSHPNMVTYQHLQNGRDTIEITPSKSNAQLRVGQTIPFTTIVYHKDKEMFRRTVEIKISDPIIIPTKATTTTTTTTTTNGSKNGKKKKRRKTVYFLKPSESGGGTERIDPPRIKAISKEKHPREWNEKFGTGNEKKGAVFFQKGSQISAVVNLSHPTLVDTQNKAKGNPKRDAKRHAHAVGLIPWALYLLQESKEQNYFETQDDPDKKYELTDFMEMVSDAIAFFGVDFIDRIRK